MQKYRLRFMLHYFPFTLFHSFFHSFFLFNTREAKPGTGNFGAVDITRTIPGAVYLFIYLSLSQNDLFL